MKVCSKCNIEKDLVEFSKAKGNSDGLNGWCKPCVSIYNKEYKEKNRSLINSKQNDRYHNNKEHFKVKNKEYRDNNKEKVKEQRRLNYIKDKEIIDKRNKKYRDNHKEKVLLSKKVYRDNNKEKISTRHKDFYPEINKKRRERRATEPLFALKNRLRCRMSNAFKVKNYKKTSHTYEILGVEWEIVKKHIERQFTKDMNWDNRSLWHIDHVIPLDSATTEEELIKLCHYTNLKPEWATYNLEKSNNIIEGTQVNLGL